MIFFLLLIEADYVNLIAKEYQSKGVKVQVEKVLWDRSRVDLLTPVEAIEVDYAKKWTQAIGQSLYYAELTGKKPCIILLYKSGEERFIYRAQTICSKYNIKLIPRKIE